MYQGRIDEKALSGLPENQRTRAEAVLSSLEGERNIVAFDGRCASGKTTLAQDLEKVTGASVIHMDDFFLPPSLRTEERFAAPGGNVHYERFQEEVIPFLRKTETFSYRRFDCSKMDYGRSVLVPAASLVIVEGTYALHPVLGRYYDKGVFLTIESEEQVARLRRRCPEKLEAFLTRWIPLEEAYFNHYRIGEGADLVL